MMLLQSIIDIIETVAPLSAQEAWDNSGLQVGNRATEVDSVLLCLDITEQTIAEAIEKHCQLIISHHPLLFHGLKQIEGKSPVERCVLQAIQHGIAIYSSHTAMDSYLHGVSGEMAARLGLQNIELLGNVKKLNGVDYGLGVVGDLPQEMPYNAFLSLVQRVFACEVIKYTLPPQGSENSIFAKEGEVKNFTSLIKRIAMVGGAGSEFLEDAIQAGADAFITADCKYHEFQQAQGRIALLDIGHYESEQYTKNIFARLLKEKAPQLKINIAESECGMYKVWK